MSKEIVQPNGNNHEHGPPVSSSSTSVVATVREQYQYQGPIPPASELKKYEDLQPGLADRIVKMAEANLQAEIEDVKLARKLQGQELNAKATLMGRGQVFALTTSLVGIGGSLAALWMGSVTVAGILAGTTVTIMVSSFLQLPSRKKGTQHEEPDETGESQ